MDASRNIHQAPADSPNLPPQNPTSSPTLIAQLRASALALASGRINRRDRWEGRRIEPETFCMECRFTQADPDKPAHDARCNVGRVLAVLAAIEAAEQIEPGDGPGVDGYSPIRGLAAFMAAWKASESYELNPGEVAQLRDELPSNGGAR